MYQKYLIHGETTGEMDAADRFLEVRTSDDGDVVLYTEDELTGITLCMSAGEALALIAALSEAVQAVVTRV